mgnify:CR=1 FL=1|jgi:hypothetical protein
MTTKTIGNQNLGIAFINEEDKILVLSIYPLSLRINYFKKERLQIRISIFKLELGIFLGAR